MKNYGRLVLVALMLFSATGIFAQGIDFKELSFDKACELAKKENKIVFVDFTMDGCAPCKMMKKNIFPQPKVGAFFNKYFVSITININRSKEGAILATESGVEAFPAFGFYELEYQDLVHISHSYKKADLFLKMGERALHPTRNSTYLIDNYLMGKRDLDFLVEYYIYLRMERKDGKAGEVYKVMNEKYSQEIVDKKISDY